MTPEEHAQQCAEQAIASNNAWHQRNLRHLVQKIDYLHQKNLIGVQKASHDYLTDESKRLRSRIEIMERYHIDSAPSPYTAEAVALHKQAGVLLDALIADEKAKQTLSEAQETALPLQPVQIYRAGPLDTRERPCSIVIVAP